MKKPILKSEKIVAKNGFIRVLSRDYEYNNKRLNYLISWKDIDNNRETDAVMILWLTKDKKVIYIREYFIWVGEFHIALPAWMIEFWDDEEKTVKKELKEEAWYETDKIIYLWEAVMHKYMYGKIKYFLALECEDTEEQELEDWEIIEVKLAEIKEFEEKIISWEVSCAHTITAFYRAKMKTENFKKFNFNI